MARHSVHLVYKIVDSFLGGMDITLHIFAVLVNIEETLFGENFLSFLLIVGVDLSGWFLSLVCF